MVLNIWRCLAQRKVRDRFRHPTYEWFQTQMIILFPFLRDNYLHTSLLIMRTRSFFYSPLCRGYIHKVSVHLVQKYFLHDFSTDSISCSEQRKKIIWWKQYQNKTANRQRQNSVTFSNPIARKINTPLLLPIHWACRQPAAASVVVSDPLDASSILRQCLCYRCCSLCYNLPPPTP